MSRIHNRDQLLANATHEAMRERRAIALDLFEAALEAADPIVCTKRAIHELKGAGELSQPVTLFAFGKAARGMADAAWSELEVKRGIVIGFEEGKLGPLTLFAGSHPVPSEHAPEHAQAMLELARSLTRDDVALVLVSGGGSALLEAPATGLTMQDLQTTTRALLASGADIREVNAVRRALSQVKGGRLARAMGEARVINIVLSDVIGSPLTSIASGPTVAPDPGEPSALDIITRYQLERALPASVLQRARRASVDHDASGFARVHSVIAADNLVAQQAMETAAQTRGLHAGRREAYLSGEARELGPRLLAEARAHAPVYIAGGETTVTLRGNGRGGRNQELVLAAHHALAAGELFASLGTDGVDGTSDAAGALWDEGVAERARTLGLDPQAFLARNDSHTFFAAVGSQILTGRTGTNVTDVCLVVRDL